MYLGKSHGASRVSSSQSSSGVLGSFVAWLLILATSALAFGCSSESPASNVPDTKQDPIRIVATTGMVTDIVRQVVGGRGEVEGLIGADVDPHLFRPTRSDVQRLMNASVIFYNGLLLEGQMTDTLVRAATAGRKVFAVTELLDASFLLEAEDYENAFDPHVWMDPRAWMKAVEVVRDSLAELDPAGKFTYEQNAAAYLEELADLDAYARRVLETVPENKRVLVTAHDAFGYFGRRFGFEVVGIQGISTESEAGVRDIERLVDMLVTRGIGAVFIESTVPDRAVRAVIAGAAARGHTVRIGGELFSDAMGEAGTYEGTYIGMIDHNVTTIANALGGEAPSKGMRGKLSP